MTSNRIVAQSGKSRTCAATAARNARCSMVDIALRLTCSPDMEATTKLDEPIHSAEQGCKWLRQPVEQLGVIDLGTDKRHLFALHLSRIGPVQH
jgi:hypothetical protein